ncbi:NAD(P)H-dependent flavin oxidoreductase [Chloroflexota bacterium]
MRTRVTDLLGIKYPIILAGMALASDVRLAVAVSEAGGLGILASDDKTLDEVRENIRQIRSQTNNPFGVNLFAGDPMVNEKGKVIVEEKVPVISHGRGAASWIIESAKAYGGLIMPTVGRLKHALRAEQDGADILVVQGTEGAGHTGYVASTVLLPLVASRVKVPVIAAGGFCDGRGLAAALALGAEGIYMGTRFAITQESPVHEATKQLYLRATDEDTIITPLVTGTRARGLRNKLSELAEQGGGKTSMLQTLRYTLQISWDFKVPFWKVLLSGLKMKQADKVSWGDLGYIPSGWKKLREGILDGNVDWGWVPSGQVCGRITDIPTCKELIETIVADAQRLSEEIRNKLSTAIEDKI